MTPLTTVQHYSSAPFNGGAGRAGYRIHEGLLQLKLDSHWIQARIPTEASPNITNWSKPKKRLSIASFSRKKNKKRFKNVFRGTHTCATTPEDWANHKAFETHTQASILNFHWMGQFLDWASLPEITRHRPVVWTLHDINPLQGVWHYAPTNDEVNEARKHFDQLAFNMKAAALAKVDPKNLVFVGPSKWMVEQCKSSQLTQNFECHHIPSGLDTKVFSPIDTPIAKQALGIDPKQKVVGFIADTIHDPRKGMAGLQQALNSLHQSTPPLLLTVGNSDGGALSNSHMHLGSLQDDRLLRLFYSACDVFICPSQQDNLPNTVLESMACQTPVIGFDVGGLPDMIRPGISGYLVPPQNINQLAIVIQHALNNAQELIQLGAGARNLATSEFDLHIAAERYQQLYTDRLSLRA